MNKNNILQLTLNLLGIPSFLSIFGSALIIVGFSLGNLGGFIALISGMLWILTDNYIFIKEIKELLEI